MLMYAQDYDDQFPCGAVGRGVKANDGSVTAGVGWAGGLYPYTKNPEVFRCPDEEAHPVADDGFVPGLYTVSYSYNRNFALGSHHAAVSTSELNNPAVTVLLSEVKGNLANVRASAELPSSNPPTYSSAGDGINYLYWTNRSNNAMRTRIQYDGGVPGGYRCDAAPNPPAGCGGFSPANNYSGRHDGGNYVLADGHVMRVARIKPSEQTTRRLTVSAGANASSSTKGQTVKNGIVYAAGTSALGNFDVTYSIK